MIFLAWGLGAKNGDAAFQVSQAFDKYQIPVVRFPGGGAAMVMGVIVAALGVGEMVIGYRRTWWHTAVSVSALLFVLAFLCWMATGNPDNPLGITGMVQQTIVSAIPFILGALAGIVCERSGVINVAIEGQMLLGAFAGALFASSASNLGIGVVAAMLGGAVIAVLLAVFAIRYLVNQVVLGVVLNAFALGLTNLGYQSIMQSDPNSYNAGQHAVADQDPAARRHPGHRHGAVRRQHHQLPHLRAGHRHRHRVVPHPVGVAHPGGRRAPARGRHGRASRCAGTRYRNVIIGGLIAGLAGAALTVGGSGAFNANISSGKGFIALAAVIFGRWSPRGAIAAALLFGFTDELQTLVTAVTPPVTIPSAFLSMAPYVVTVVAVAGFVGRVQAPAADGEPYVKG